jgi:hypothetical protein
MFFSEVHFPELSEFCIMYGFVETLEQWLQCYMFIGHALTSLMYYPPQEKYGPKGQNKLSSSAQGKPDKPKPNADVDINVGLSTRPPWFCRYANAIPQHMYNEVCRFFRSKIVIPKSSSELCIDMLLIIGVYTYCS